MTVLDIKNVDDGYRALMCASIYQAIELTQGKGMSRITQEKKKARKIREEEIKYIFSEQFEFDCGLVGLEKYINDIREYVKENLSETDM